MAKKICSCSNFLSCFSCFSAANNHHASPSSTTPNAASLRVDTQTALSSSSDKEGTSSSGISAAVKQHDSQLPESASVGGSSSPSKVPSPPPSIPSEPARVGTIPTEKHDSQLPESASVGGSSSPSKVPSPPPSIPSEPARVGTIPTEVPKNEKVGEGCSSSSRNDDATLQTAPDLSSQMVKDVVGESVDLDGLMEHISQLLEIIEGKNSSPQLQRRVEDYFPTTSKIVSKLKMFLFEGKDVLPGEAIKTAVDVVLQGMVAADFIIAPFVVVASILERFGDVGDNENECISLLKEMIFLGKVVKQFQESPQLKGSDGISGVIKEATELIVEGSVLCCTQMKSSKFSEFWAASVNKEELSKFRQKLRDMYTHIYAPRKTPRSRGYPKHSVGLEEAVKEVLELLEWGSQRKTVAVMLHGFGGMGKTTLADAVFSLANFEECKYSKVQLFKNIESKPDVIELQKCIVKDLMGHEDTIPDIRKYEDGQRVLGYMLEKVTAFIYIDNVLGENELRQLLPTDPSKAKKLRLLVTARDINVGRAFPRETSPPKIYSMKIISNSNAVSFLKREVLDDMEEKLNSSQIVSLIDMCGGVPLMLTLVAKVLRFGQDKQKAYNIILQHKQDVKGQMFVRTGGEKYFFAYDSLPDEYKDPFLDVCLFFKGWDWDTVADIVGKDQLDMLEKRALVTKSIDSTASVHDVILTIGQQKAKGTRFKFTSASRFEKFLDHDEEKEIKGIWFGENKDPCSITASKLDSMCKSLRVVDLGNFTKVEGRCNEIFENLVFFKGGITQLPFDVSKIENLKYLKYEPEDLTLPKMPSSLRHMEFDGRLQSPAFEISSACLQQLGNLRILRLINFAELKKLPEQMGDQVKVLQELSLSHCKSLEEPPTSISRLQSLRLMKMDYCSSLKQLAEDFGSLKSLQCLDLKGCFSLKQLTEDFGSLSSLQELDLQGCTGLKALPNSFENLSSLRFLNLSSCESLEDLPHGLGNLSSLVALDFHNCHKLISIPESIRQLKLTAPFMAMSHCLSLNKLPDGFCHLFSITHLDLRECRSLHTLPYRFGELASLRSLFLAGCSSLQRLPEGFGQLRYLEKLDLHGCSRLEELCNEFHCLTSLYILNMNMCESLKKLPEDFHRLVLLQHLELRFCSLLEGESMDNVLKLKMLKIVNIEGSGMLLDRWAEIQRKSDESWVFKEKVIAGQVISVEQKENLEKNMLSQLEFLLSEGREKPFRASCPLLVIIFDVQVDFTHGFPWPLIEETMDDFQIEFEMVYIGLNFDKLPPKAQNMIVGHLHNPVEEKVINLLSNLTVTLGQQVKEYLNEDNIVIIQISMLEAGGGGLLNPCWKLLTKLEMEEFLLCNCRKYLQLKQLVEESQESNTKLLTELFATEEAQTCTFQQAAGGNAKPSTFTAEELKGKTILLEIRPLDVCYDVRLASLTQLYTVKERHNLEIISIPLVQRSSSKRIDVFVQFSRDIPWLVIQNPWAIPSAVKYFLINLCVLHEEEIRDLSLIKIIEPDGTIFTASKPVMGLLERWGAESYPFTVQKIKDLKEEEWNRMETMSAIEFLLEPLERALHQVEKAKLDRKVACLYGGKPSEVKKFRRLIRNQFPRNSIQYIICIPSLNLKPVERLITDTIVWFHQPLAQHDVSRFWRRVSFLKEEISEMYNHDPDKLAALRKLFQCWDNDNPWMIFMDEEGKIMWSCKGSMEDEAGLIELLIKGSQKQIKEASCKLEQLPDVSNYDGQ